MTSSDLPNRWGVESTLFEDGSCREIWQKRFGFELVYADGTRDWFMQVEKHPEHASHKDLVTAVNKVRETRQLVARLPTTSEAAADSALWEEIKFSTRVSDFQRYLEKYPNGLFVALAENQIRDLVERQSQGGGIANKFAGIQFGRYHALVIGIDEYN